MKAGFRVAFQIKQRPRLRGLCFWGRGEKRLLCRPNAEKKARFGRRQKSGLRAVYASNSRLTAGKARLRLFGGKDLPTNPCEHFKYEML